MVQTTLRDLTVDEAVAAGKRGAALVDLRDLSDYLDGHIRGSVGLVYEFGPGMAGRARDCIPLSVPLVLMDSPNANLMHAAASLRGKGFSVLGKIDDALNRWSDRLTSTDVLTGPDIPHGAVLDVADPGRLPYTDALFVPMERMWARAAEFEGETSITVLCGAGARAALAVGVLERAGVSQIKLWRHAQRPAV